MNKEKNTFEIKDVKGKIFEVSVEEILYTFSRVISRYVPLSFEAYKSFLSALKGK